MKRNNKNIPEGTRDIIFRNAEVLNEVMADITEVYSALNYKEIKTPTLEYYDVFDFDSQPIAQELMYKLTDSSGRLAVLRPDNTTPVARVAASKLRNERLPLKIYYNQNVYRINADYSGKKNEYLQSGIEIIGGDRFRTDIFYIETALSVLKSLNLGYKLEIGHAAFFSAVVNKLNLDDATKEQIRALIEAKNINSPNLSLESKIDEDTYRLICEIPKLFGGEEALVKARELVRGNKEALEVLDYIGTLYNIFCSAGYKDNIIVDLGMAHSLNYYTGCVISGYVEGIGESILIGGRYDNLIGNFGYDVLATGFAVNINKIAELKIKNNHFCGGNGIKRILHYDEASFSAVKEYIGRCEDRCEISCFSNLEDTVAYAKSQKIGIVAVINNNCVEEIEYDTDSVN